MRGTRITVAAVAALVSLATSASLTVARPPATAANSAVPAAAYPAVFVPTGQWELTYTWPGHPAEHELETFTVDPTRTSTFGYQVYRTTECSLDGPGPRLDGTVWAEFYVYPHGLLFSGLRPGNGPTRTDGDMGTLSGSAANDPSRPLVFAGPWLDARGPGGTFTLARSTRPMMCQITRAAAAKAES